MSKALLAVFMLILALAFTPLAFVLMPLIVIAVVAGAIYMMMDGMSHHDHHHHHHL